MSTGNETEKDFGPGSNEIERDDWPNISDPTDRRKAQNRIAQRKYRQRKKTENEDRAHIAANQDTAGSAYSHTEPEDLRPNDNPSGLPWGSIDMRDVVEKGKAREQKGPAVGTGSSAAGGGG